MTTYMSSGRIFGDAELPEMVRESLDDGRVLSIYAGCYGYEEAVRYLGGFYDGVEDTLGQLGIDPGEEDSAFRALEWFQENGDADLAEPIRGTIVDAALHGTADDLFALTGIRTMSSGHRGTVVAMPDPVAVEADAE